MTTTLGSPVPATSRPAWRDVIMPREHGSWSLALEPIALGLLMVPSIAGGCLAVATFAAFLARRPLKLAIDKSLPLRRRFALQALFAMGGLAAVFATLAVSLSVGGFVFWLLPPAALGAVFLWFDLRRAGREQAAEICGSAAFGMIAGAIVAAGGSGPTTVLLVSFLMLARAVPTVLFVRAIVRGNKTGVLHPAVALATAIGVTAIAALLAFRGVLPLLTAAAVALLLVRAAFFLRGNRMRLRAKTLGLQELGIGVLYLATVAATWRP